MNDKKILIALTPSDAGHSLIAFTERFVAGENLDVTVVLIRSASGVQKDFDEVVDRLYLICVNRNIPFRMRELPASQLTGSLTAFADLLVVEHGGLKYVAASTDRHQNGCAVLVLPALFSEISNVLLVLDGGDLARRSVKQFFQIFSRHTRTMDVTLLLISNGENPDMQGKDELLLIEYIRPHCKDLGILKVQTPLTEKMLRPVQFDSHTVIVGTLEFLLAQKGKTNTFRPIRDAHSPLFLPAEP